VRCLGFVGFGVGEGGCGVGGGCGFWCWVGVACGVLGFFGSVCVVVWWRVVGFVGVGWVVVCVVLGCVSVCGFGWGLVGFFFLCLLLVVVVFGGVVPRALPLAHPRQRIPHFGVNGVFRKYPRQFGILIVSSGCRAFH